jgi:hypothetical protein
LFTVLVFGAKVLPECTNMDVTSGPTRAAAPNAKVIHEVHAALIHDGFIEQLEPDCSAGM